MTTYDPLNSLKTGRNCIEKVIGDMKNENHNDECVIKGIELQLEGLRCSVKGRRERITEMEAHLADITNKIKESEDDG